MTTVSIARILTMLGIMTAGVWSATQWLVAALGYDSRLGTPWFDIGGMPVYPPWRLFEWWYALGRELPAAFDTAGKGVVLSALLSMAAAGSSRPKRIAPAT